MPIFGVLEAVKLARLVVPPIAPLNVIVPLPAINDSAWVPAALLLTVPSAMPPPAEFNVLSPAIVVAPSVMRLPLELMFASKVVTLAVLVKPLLKLNVSLVLLPSVTPFVFRNVIALVKVFVAPSIITA